PSMSRARLRSIRPWRPPLPLVARFLRPPNEPITVVMQVILPILMGTSGRSRTILDFHSARTASCNCLTNHPVESFSYFNDCLYPVFTLSGQNPRCWFQLRPAYRVLRYGCFACRGALRGAPSSLQIHGS